MLATVDWSAVGAIGGLLLAILAGVVRLIVLATRLSTKVDSHGRNIKENTRHLESMMSSQWTTIWRVTSMEEYLEDNGGYRPPRLFPKLPGDGD